MDTHSCVSVLELVNFHYILYVHNYIKATASSGKGSLTVDVNETSPTDESTTDNSPIANIQLAVGIPVGVVTIVTVVFVAIILVIKKCKQQKEVVTKNIALPERYN